MSAVQIIPISQFTSCSLKKDSEAKETLSNKQHIPWPVCSSQFGLGIGGGGEWERRGEEWGERKWEGRGEERGRGGEWDNWLRQFSFHIFFNSLEPG